MKKVLLITHNCNFVSNFLIPQINVYKDLGFSVYLASSKDLGELPKDVDSFFDISIKQSPVKIIENYRAFKKLKKIIVEENISIVNCHTPMGGVLGRLLKIPYPELEVIYTAHGFHFYKGSSIINWLIYYPIEKFLSRYTDKQIVINQEDFKTLKFRNFKSKKKYLVNGVGVESIIPNQSIRKSIISNYYLDQSELVIISVGQLNKNKNHKLIIESMQFLTEKYPSAKLLILGDGPLRNELNNLIEEMNLENNVTLVGYTENVIEFLSVSDILISASLREGLPKNVMEALNQGIPCVVSDCRGNRDLIKENFNGCIFKEYKPKLVFDTILEVISNYDLLSYNAKISVDPFLVESVIKDYRKIFQEEIL